MQVCKDADVELHVVPLTDEYWDRVVAHSIAEIKAGRTPNPDILCNSRCVLHADREQCVFANGWRCIQPVNVWSEPCVVYSSIVEKIIARRRAECHGAHS